MKFIVVAKFSTVPLNAEIINPIILDNNPTMIKKLKIMDYILLDVKETK